VTERIRVMIVDDHLMVRRGLSTFLRAARDLELVGEAEAGAEAIRICEKTRPDVVRMDLRLPDVDGIDATRAIRQAHPQIRVIVLTSSHEDELVSQALGAGAIGYLLKDVGVTSVGTRSEPPWLVVPPSRQRRRRPLSAKRQHRRHLVMS